MSSYDRRSIQLWSVNEDGLRTVLQHRLGRPDGYDSAVDDVCERIVMHALRRNPVAFARVVATTVGQYFWPPLWQTHLPGELGQDRPLPQSLLTIVNDRSAQKLNAASNGRRTLLVRCLEAVIKFYPWQLAVGVLLSLRGLARRGAGDSERVFSATLLATLLAAGLYSNNVIPRYVLTAVIAGWLLVGKAVEAGCARVGLLMRPDGEDPTRTSASKPQLFARGSR